MFGMMRLWPVDLLFFFIFFFFYSLLACRINLWRPRTRPKRKENKNDKYMLKPPHLRKPNPFKYIIFKSDSARPRRTPPSNPPFPGSACIHHQRSPNPPFSPIGVLPGQTNVAIGILVNKFLSRTISHNARYGGT